MKKLAFTLIGSVMAAGAMAAAPDAPSPPTGGAAHCAPPTCKPVTDEDRRKQAKANEIIKNTKGNKTAAKDDELMKKQKDKAEGPPKP